MNAFDGIEIETAEHVSLAVIWLHGLGADGHDFEPIVPELALPMGVRFVFPHAPRRPVTINAGTVMRAWFDILDFGAGAQQDTRGIEQSVRFLQDLIEREEARGIARQRIVLAGFSQGGAIALHAGLTDSKGVGGILGLSTFLPLPQVLAARWSPAAASTPVWMAHGTEDPVIPLAYAESSKAELESLGARVEWHSYVMGHSVCAEEIRDMATWLGTFG